MLISITIKRESEGSFSPQFVQAQVGDGIFWRNADNKTLHQPYLVTAGDWAANPIQPGETSTQVNAGLPGTFHYRCAMHPDESGVLMVCTPAIIGPVGDGTSAFSMANSAIPEGTSICFGNADAKQHWPMPQSGSQTDWFKAALNPGDLSAPLPFDSVQNVAYKCALHPTETGNFQVRDDFQPPNTPLTVEIPASPGLADPQFLQIVVNQTVKFSNKNSSAHQPAPDDGDTWFANAIQPGASGSFQFTKAGTYRYHDALSTTIKGIIQVGQK